LSAVLFFFVTQRYFQGAHGALLLYDCTRSTTLDSIVNWEKELNERVYQRNGDPLPTVLIGTKVSIIVPYPNIITISVYEAPEDLAIMISSIVEEYPVSLVY